MGQDLEAQIQRLVREPAGGGRARALRASGATDSLFRLRGPVLAAMRRSLEPGEPLLVATRDKVRIAGAVLACLAGGNELLVPHTDSPAVLEELRDAQPVRFALVDDPGGLPAWLAALPVDEEEADPGPGAVRGPADRIARLFTGGSTGRPRVWEKTVENLLGDAAFQAGRFGVGPGDVILAAVTPQHIYGMLYTVFLPLVSGAAVVAGTPCFQAEMEEAARRYGATVFAGAPPHYRALRERGLAGQGLRLAVSSGGMLPEEDSLRFSGATGVPVTEIYGSTETGGIALRRRAGGEALWSPFPCVQWRIRRGRLCVKSPFLSPGLALDRDGFFVTGDRARREPGGRFDLLGRADGVVKVGGKRVDLEAVEARIKSLPFVRDAYVLALAVRGMRASEVVCLVVPEPGQDLPGDLRGALGRVLEPHDLPRRVRRVPEIPLTPAGKRDREGAERMLEG